MSEKEQFRKQLEQSLDNGNEHVANIHDDMSKFHVPNRILEQLKDIERSETTAIKKHI